MFVTAAVHTRFLAVLGLFSLVCTSQLDVAVAQELEPRAYSPSPVGTNFLAGAYSYSWGDVLVDPSLPISDVDAKFHTFSPGYSHTFGLFGRAVSVAGTIPLVSGKVEGEVGETHREVTREGQGDFRFRLTTNIIGGEALTPQEFAASHPNTLMGMSLIMIAPTGRYNSERLINLGSNRWAFKPEIGGSHLFGSWFIDGSAGVWFYTNNDNFYGGTERSQDPLATFQLHGGYVFSPGLWLAADGVYYTGGETSIDGLDKNDQQDNSRYGVTLAMPLSGSTSVKLAFSKGYTTRAGGDFSTILAALQYRWFD